MREGSGYAAESARATPRRRPPATARAPPARETARPPWPTRDRSGSWSCSSQGVFGVGLEPFDAGVSTLDGRHLHLNHQLLPGKAGDTTAERGGAALGEPCRSLSIWTVHVGAVDRESPTADDVVQRGARLLQGPADGLVGQVALGGPVTDRLDLVVRGD